MWESNIKMKNSRNFGPTLREIDLFFHISHFYGSSTQYNMSGGHYMSRCEYLGALIMEFNPEGRIFVNMQRQAMDAEQRKKMRLKRAGWLCVAGFCELLGTGMLVFIGCTGSAPSLTPEPPSGIQISVLYGFAIFLIIQILFHISGGHINPIITVAAFIFKLVSWQAAIVYVVAQLVGGILGYGVMLIIVPKEALYLKGKNMNYTHGHCAIVPNPKVSLLQAFIGEYIATAILILLCCSLWDKRNEAHLGSAPIKIGLTILVLALALAPISGCGINPARALAPAIYTGVWRDHWIFWIAPVVATVSISFFYKLILEKIRDPDKEVS